MTTSRRSLRNHPLFGNHVESRFLLFCLIITTSVFAVFALVCLTGVTANISGLTSVYQIPPELIERIQSSIRQAMIFVAIGGLIVTVIGLSLAYTLITRIYGPMVPVRRLLHDLIEGRFGETVTTRRGDEFGEVVALINQLSIRLKENNEA